MIVCCLSLSLPPSLALWQGYRSVADLEASGVLNRQQRIGVRHYQDFQERMMREEVAQIEKKVR